MALGAAMSTVLRLIANAVRADETSALPILLIFAGTGLVISLFAALNGLEILDF